MCGWINIHLKSNNIDCLKIKRCWFERWKKKKLRKWYPPLSATFQQEQHQKHLTAILWVILFVFYFIFHFDVYFFLFLFYAFWLFLFTAWNRWKRRRKNKTFIFIYIFTLGLSAKFNMYIKLMHTCIYAHWH